MAAAAVSVKCTLAAVDYGDAIRRCAGAAASATAAEGIRCL